MNWQERLNEHEETAPQDGWAQLQQNLELDSSGLREKMLALESEPPATAWPGIRKSLEPRMSSTARLLPFFRRHATTAAIAASLVLVFFIYRGALGDMPPVAIGGAAGIQSAIHEKPANPAKEHIQPDPANLADNTTGTSLKNPDLTWSAAKPEIQTPAYKKSAHRKAKPTTITQGANYIEICGEKAECDRLTYKLEDWAPCLNATCSDARGLQIEKARRIEAWRAKMEQSTYVPAAGHFFDIGEMAMLLQSAER